MSDYKKLKYHYFKHKNKCVKCGKKDERTLSGKILCEECEVKANEYKKAHKKQRTEEQKAHHREYTRKLRSERKAKGLCPYCGMPAVNGTVRCERHRQECKDYYRRKKNDLHCN